MDKQEMAWIREVIDLANNGDKVKKRAGREIICEQLEVFLDYIKHLEGEVKVHREIEQAWQEAFMGEHRAAFAFTNSHKPYEYPVLYGRMVEEVNKVAAFLAPVEEVKPYDRHRRVRKAG